LVFFKGQVVKRKTNKYEWEILDTAVWHDSQESNPRYLRDRQSRTNSVSCGIQPTYIRLIHRRSDLFFFCLTGTSILAV